MIFHTERCVLQVARVPRSQVGGLTQTGWRVAPPLATVPTGHLGIAQQVEPRVALVDHRAARLEVGALVQAVLQGERGPARHACPAHRGSGG